MSRGIICVDPFGSLSVKGWRQTTVFKRAEDVMIAALELMVLHGISFHHYSTNWLPRRAVQFSDCLNSHIFPISTFHLRKVFVVPEDSGRSSRACYCLVCRLAWTEAHPRNRREKQTSCPQLLIFALRKSQWAFHKYRCFHNLRLSGNGNFFPPFLSTLYFISECISLNLFEKHMLINISMPNEIYARSIHSWENVPLLGAPHTHTHKKKIYIYLFLLSLMTGNKSIKTDTNENISGSKHTSSLAFSLLKSSWKK